VIIRKLTIENFRNLERAELTPHERLNYIYGSNGAGKTSILEALVVLSRGRSFRTNSAAELIGPNAPTFRVVASTEDERKKVSTVGLERSRQRWRGRLNGKDLSQLSQLTRLLPLVLMEPDSHLLVSGPPEVRRKYMDWGMFHVEQNFLNAWREFSKSLKQRNAALRHGDSVMLDSLDEVLAKNGTRLGKHRTKYAEHIEKAIGGMMNSLSESVSEVGITYHDGWAGDTYLESLKESRKRDLDRNMTSTGPHRADLKFRCGKHRARAVLSRGEQKVFAAALVLTQAEILQRAVEAPLVLLDDLASEFDQSHFGRVLQRAQDLGSQVWVTGTEKPAIGEEHRVFHVEQGVVRQVV
jgi:DNA replication and repair protein RecF